MKKLGIILSLLLFCLPICLLGSCEQVEIDENIKSIEIYRETTQIEELIITEGDTVELFAYVDGTPTYTFDTIVDIWESSNEAIATVKDGTIKGVKNGKVVITVSVNGMPFINDSIYLTVNSKVQQTGVGSGLSKEDPIFKGNEGKEEPIEVRFIEMQHIYSDSIFIKKGGVEILIDAGYEYDGEYVNKIIKQYCTDGRLDVLMASHADGDHIDGMANALKDVENISLMVDYGGIGTGNIGDAREKYTKKGMIYHSAYDSVNKINGASDIYYLTEDFYFEVLNTGYYITANEKSASNPESLAVIFYYKNFSFFTGGDITTATETSLLKNEDLPEVTLMKAAHHGSHGSNSQEFLDTLNPKAVAISAARANQYQAKPGVPNKNNTYNLNGASGHPAAEAIGRIYKAPNISKNLNVYWNAVNGTMKFTSYGKNDFTFEGSTPLKGYYDLSLTDGKAVWNDALNDFENKVTGEENFKLHETKVFLFRDYVKYLPEWAKNQYFPNN